MSRHHGIMSHRVTSCHDISHQRHINVTSMSSRHRPLPVPTDLLPSIHQLLSPTSRRRYEEMKSTSMERPKSEQVKQQLRCSPLDTNTGPMACFVALQNVIEVVGHVDSLVCIATSSFCDACATTRYSRVVRAVRFILAAHVRAFPRHNEPRHHAATRWPPQHSTTLSIASGARCSRFACQWSWCMRSSTRRRSRH